MCNACRSAAPRPLSRRRFLQSAALSAGSVPLLAGRDAFAQATPAASSREEVTEGITTLTRSIAPADYRQPGLPYRRVGEASGWPLVVRQDLAAAQPHRVSARIGLVAFAQLTDLHIIDAASPAHPTFLRQFPGQFGGADLSNGFRTQDTLSVHVLDAMVRRINALEAGPVTGRPLDFAISTGDNADDRGTHELEAVLAVLNGGRTGFNATGGAYVGLQDNDTSVPEDVYAAFWHPDPAPGGFADDSWKRAWGYPTLPGLLAAASRAIDAPGLDIHWYTGFGNHDIVDAGVLPAMSGPALLLDLLATGDQMPYGLPSGMALDDFFGTLLQATSEDDVRALIARMPMRTVPASAVRKPFTRRDFIRMHLDAPGAHSTPGHGFTQDNLDNDIAYYEFDLAPEITGIMMDTTNPNGGPDGSLDPGQVAWLESCLIAAHRRYLDADGAWVETGHENRLVVLFSHHNSRTLDNLTKAPGETTSDRMASDAFLAMLQRFPNVILWVNGHSHQNRVWPHPVPSGRSGGFWEINTAAHIDYPQQARTLEIADNRDGTLSIFGVLLDHSDPVSLDAQDDYSRSELAALSLELAMNDPALDRSLRLGTPEDRNVELLVPHPFAREQLR